MSSLHDPLTQPQSIDEPSSTTISISAFIPSNMGPINVRQYPQQDQPEYRKLSIALIFGIPAMGGFLFGWDIAVTSYAIVALQQQILLYKYPSMTTTAVGMGLIVAMSSIGALCGSMIIFSRADRIGRRTELQYAAFFYILGTMVEVLSGCLLFVAIPTTSATTDPLTFSSPSQLVETVILLLLLLLLLVGRFVYGVGIALAMHGGPTYIAEMSPSSIRGILVSMKEAAIVTGILIGYCVGYFCSKVPRLGWVYSYGTSLFISIPMLLLSIWAIPPSCRWLLLQNRPEEAMESVCFVYSKEEEAKNILEAMKQPTTTEVVSVESESPEHVSGLGLSLSTVSNLSGREMDLEDTATTSTAAVTTTQTQVTTISLWDERYRDSLIAGVGLIILQQITGQPSVLSYAAPIFRDAGLSDWSSILVAAFKLIATLVSASLVEQYGRKRLLYTGNSLMLGALFLLSYAFGQTTTAPGGILETFILVSMFIYIGGYQLSFGPIAWLMISECFPMAIRGQAVAVAVQLNFFFNALVQLAVPLLEKWIGLNVTFAIFALFTAYSLYFIKVYVPETKGMTLEEIEQQFVEIRLRRRNNTAEMERLVV